MTDAMTFPKTLDEFMEQYKIVDTEQVYTNGTELVPIFRIKQWEDAHRREKGKWLREQLALPLSDGSKECVRCSYCFTHWDNESNYCPYCGADLREEKTDDANTSH